MKIGTKKRSLILAAAMSLVGIVSSCALIAHKGSSTISVATPTGPVTLQVRWHADDDASLTNRSVTNGTHVTTERTTVN